MQMGKRTTHLRGQNTSEIPVRSKHLSHSRGEECVSESFEHNTDELVKYMSKLPGYLQGDESVQSNVLNVGVLDWGRLEKWKHGRAKGAERSAKRATKVSCTTLGTVPNASSHQYHHRCKIDDQVHASSLLGKVKASRGLQHSAHRLRCTLEPELASRDAFNKHEIATCSYNKSSRKSTRSTSGLLTEMGNSGGSLGAKGNFVVRDKESEKRAAGEIHVQEARASGNQCANNKLDGEEKTVGDSNAEKQESHHVSNIVLLRSRKQSRGTCSGESHKSSLDDNVKVTREVSSSLRLRSQVPRSCPLSFDLERDSEDMRFPLGGTRKTVSRIFDQEDESRKNRDPSPSKRFSFSIGRLSRSVTFKEDSSAGQPLTFSDDTIKFDFMRFDGSACPSPSSNPEEKQIIHCGSRVSPLRRLLDPLLKSKGSENVLSSKEKSTSSNPKPNIIDVPLQDEKKQQDTSRTGALFQLTTRNGIPLFQFVVDDDNLNNSRSILGATMKNSDSSFKDDSVQYCTFYSVNEVKKKRSGSWLIHGHKEKQQRGFLYTVIGQMRLCNSSTSSDITEKRSENVSCIIREAVLVDETEQVKGRKEVAAVVIKKKAAQENLNALGETIVIIPGGVHSFPEKGAPTPLVSRWRSGGLCDCGGWDVGCKLHVYLSNKTCLHELDHQSFKLFAQEESDKDTVPVLAMTELKTGLYRVEFDSFLSHLQAFFVCVTVIKCGSEEETVSKTTGKSSSPLAPPLSPVGRV